MLKAVKRLSLLHAMAGPAHVTGYLDMESLSRLEGDDLLTRVPVFPEHRFAFALDARQNLMALPSGDRGMPHWTGRLFLFVPPWTWNLSFTLSMLEHAHYQNGVGTIGSSLAMFDAMHLAPFLNAVDTSEPVRMPLPVADAMHLVSVLISGHFS